MEKSAPGRPGASALLMKKETETADVSLGLCYRCHFPDSSHRRRHTFAGSSLCEFSPVSDGSRLPFIYL
jgi:hypothetical protein